MTNQVDRVLTALIQGGSRGVCGTELLMMHIPRYSARLGELRAEGYIIHKAPCELKAHHHDSAQWVYTLEVPPAEQMELL